MLQGIDDQYKQSNIFFMIRLAVDYELVKQKDLENSLLEYSVALLQQLFKQILLPNNYQMDESFDCNVDNDNNLFQGYTYYENLDPIDQIFRLILSILQGRSYDEVTGIMQNYYEQF